MKLKFSLVFFSLIIGILTINLEKKSQKEKNLNGNNSFLIKRNNMVLEKTKENRRIMSRKC